VRFLLDEMFSQATVATLRVQGLEASHVRDHGLAATEDAQILEVACVEGWVFVTANLRDFRPLHAERVAAGRKVTPLLLLTQRTLNALGGSQPDGVASLIAAWAAANPSPYDGEHWFARSP
jgi:predicted nuclease of predicted toxin-antitoxin system